MHASTGWLLLIMKEQLKRSVLSSERAKLVWFLEMNS